MTTNAPKEPQSNLPRAADTQSLSHAIGGAAAVMVATRFIVRTAGLFNTLILARLLVPEDFGVVAIALTAMQLLQNISDIGVSQTVIKLKNAHTRHYDTLFMLSMIRGVIVSLILIVLAFLARPLFGDTRIGPVMAAIALAPLFFSAVNPKVYEFEKALDFSKELILSAISKLLSVCVSIVIAVVYQSYWAIAIGFLTGTALYTALSYLFRPYRPRFSLQAIQEIWQFSGWITGVSFMAALNNKLDLLILPRLIGVGFSGTFYVGRSIGDLAGEEIAAPIARAVYPGLSSIQDDQAAMRREFTFGAQLMSLTAMPAAIGCALLAYELVHVMLGERWSEAAFLIQFYTPMIGIAALFTAIQGYALASGSIAAIFWRETILFILRTPLLVIAAIMGGFSGAVLAVTAGEAIRTLMNLSLYRRLSGDRVLSLLWSLRRSFVAVALMSVVVSILANPVASVTDVIVIQLITKTIVGAAVFYGVTIVLWRAAGMPDGAEKVALERVKAVLRPR